MSDIVVGATIGDYEIQRELGRGGMGVVFKARERTLQRAVALKFLPPDLASDPKFVEDFYREARAAAQINHPNIVTIFAVGEAEGRHFIAMEYVSGQTVWSMIKRFNQIHPVQSVEIGRQVCKALSAAHKLRIYHRDIKPHNIMVDEHGLVRVLDFGIARMRDPGAMIQKVEDELSGTPTYMSPEQFKMHTTDQRSDIYSLGVTLFHMMAGRPPFVTTEREMLKKMILDAPAPFIRKFNPEVPHALVQILEKAMAKRKEDRYSQASEMEEDLHQVARALRKTASASGGAQRDTPARPGEFNTPRGIPPSTTPYGVKMPVPASPAIQQEDTWRGGSSRSFNFSFASWSKPLLFGGAALVFGAILFATIFGVLKARYDPRELLRMTGHESDVFGVALFPDEKRMVSAGADTTLRIWNLSGFVSEAEVKKAAEARQSLGSVLRGVPRRSEISLLSGHTNFVYGVAVSPDGKKILSAGADNTLRLWNAEDGSPISEFKAPELAAQAVVFSPDGRFALSGGPDKLVRLWDVSTGSLIRSMKGHGSLIYSVAFSADGRRAVSGGADKLIILWDPETGRELHRFTGHEDAVSGVCYSSDGKQILSCSWDDTIRLWDAQSGKLIRKCEGHTSDVRAAVISPDGKQILSGSWDRTVRLWDLASAKELLQISTRNDVQAVAFAAGGRVAIGAESDGTIHVWDLTVPDAPQR